jgi:tetratricopeptide (TPR) repeat protein
MATASRRLTRKEIRRPDRFITLTQTTYDFVRGHKVEVLLAAGILAAVLLGLLGWQIYITRQNTFASEDFSRAMAIYRSGNYRDALPAFEKVEAYRWSRFYSLALLYEANSYLALKDFDKSIATGRRLLQSGSSDPLLRQSALVTLASAEEQKELCKEAIVHYSEAEAISYPGARHVSGPLKDKATLGKARCSAQMGDLTAAIAAYREYLKQPDRELAAYVSAQIAALQAKATPETAK